MKSLNKSTSVVASATLLIGLGLGWLFFSGEETSGKQVAKDVASEWTCSMHPQIRKSEPGDCPICGMDLIPVENSSDEGTDPMAIKMSSTAMQLAQVQTMVVGQGENEKPIRLDGKVQTDERLVFTQSAHISGRVEKLMVNFTGEFVSKGQVIAYLYSPELVTAQEELFEAQKIKDSQPALFLAAKEKLKNWKLSERQIEQILASGKATEQYPILANISGYVIEKMVNLGDYLKQGEPIYEIANLSKVWVLFDVYESELAWINKGDLIEYTVQSIPNKTFEGKISYLDPIIDKKTRVAKARVEATNQKLLLKPEMFVSGILNATVKRSDESVSIPKTAVMWTGKRSVVYVMQNSTQGMSFRMREVTLGPELGKSYIIENGLVVGEEIAVNGTFSIDAAAQLAGKPSMMGSNGGSLNSSHNHDNIKELDTMRNHVVSKKVKVSNTAKTALSHLFESYFAMKTALSEDDFKIAKEEGLKLKKSLNSIQMNLFKGDAHSIWMKQSSSLKNSLQHVEHFENLNKIRDSFIEVSSVMIAMEESFNVVSSDIFVQNCPMANKNKGADWLSRKKQIRNPYFGKSMLTCGDVKRKLD